MNKPSSLVFSRELRKRSTLAEKILWQMLRNRRLDGFKFLRQYPLHVSIMSRHEFYIADFCCCEKKLIIELDGEIHDRQKDYDEMRDKVLNSKEYSVMRFSNDEIMQNMDEVQKRIILYLKSNK
jgi:very-short-patch-repair endonuclease